MQMPGGLTAAGLIAGGTEIPGFTGDAWQGAAFPDGGEESR